MDWKEEEEREAAPLPASSFGWTLPPMDMLAAGPAADAEIAKPDNAARAALIVETLASFGVDARVSAYHEGPVVTQFDIEPGWEIKYRTVAERDRDGKPSFDKDGKPQHAAGRGLPHPRARQRDHRACRTTWRWPWPRPSLRIEAPGARTRRRRHRGAEHAPRRS